MANNNFSFVPSIFDAGPTVEEYAERHRQQIAQASEESTDNSSPFVIIYGNKTENRLALSNVEFSLGGSAAYDSFEFQGRPEQHYAYKSGKTNNLSLKFDLYATAQEQGMTKSSRNIWKAQYEDGVNQMGVRDLEWCTNWLMSTLKPKKKNWAPPERLTISVFHFIKAMDFVTETCEKTIIDKAGYQVNSQSLISLPRAAPPRMLDGPKGISITMNLIPIFDLHKVPFRDDIIRGNYNL